MAYRIVPLGIGALAVSTRHRPRFYGRCRHCGAPAENFWWNHPTRGRVPGCAHLYGEAHCEAPCPWYSRCRCVPLED